MEMLHRPVGPASRSCPAVLCNRTLLLPLDCLGWKNGGYLCTQGVGLKSHFAARLVHALSHSPNPDADFLGVNHCQSFWRYSLTVILNLGINLIGLAGNADGRRLASRMPVDVCQALLHETKDGEFHLRGKPSEIVRDIQPDTNAATLRQSVNVPAKCGRQ